MKFDQPPSSGDNDNKERNDDAIEAISLTAQEIDSIMSGLKELKLKSSRIADFVTQLERVQKELEDKDPEVDIAEVHFTKAHLSIVVQGLKLVWMNIQTVSKRMRETQESDATDSLSKALQADAEKGIPESEEHSDEVRSLIRRLEQLLESA
jgi:leucyl aminopeptidase